jgi:hypothetical protein
MYSLIQVCSTETADPTGRTPCCMVRPGSLECTHVLLRLRVRRMWHRGSCTCTLTPCVPAAGWRPRARRRQAEERSGIGRWWRRRRGARPLLISASSADPDERKWIGREESWWSRRRIKNLKCHSWPFFLFCLYDPFKWLYDRARCYSQLAISSAPTACRFGLISSPQYACDDMIWLHRQGSRTRRTYVSARPMRPACFELGWLVESRYVVKITVQNVLRKPIRSPIRVVVILFHSTYECNDARSSYVCIREQK